MGLPPNAIPRLEVFTSIEVCGAGGLATAVLVELSRTDAGFLTEDGLGAPGERLELFLPQVEDVQVDADGHLKRRSLAGHIRQVERRGAKTLVRMALVPVTDPETQRRLDQYLASLLALAESGEGKREHPRLQHRMQARYGETRQLGELRDLSAGGMGLLVRAPMEVGEEATFTLLDQTGEDLLALRGVVRRQSLEPDGGLPVRVGIEFVRLAPERRQCLEALLRHYLTPSAP